MSGVLGTRIVVAVACVLLGLGASGVAHAQGFGQPGFGPPGGPPPGSPPPGQPPPGSGAASGVGEGQALPTEAATLPEDPLAVPIPVKKKIGTDAERDTAKGEAEESDFDFYGLYMSQTSGQYRFRTVFPLWAERTMPGDRTSMYSPFYLQRRSEEVDQDILFPLFWKLRERQTYTTIVGPWMHQESEREGDEPGGHQNWLAPLFFEGGDEDGGGYLHVPPLLTFTQHTDHDGFNLAGPLFCSWTGGPSCDPRTTDDVDLGIVPFYFYGRDKTSEYELIPPLLHYYSYSDKGDASFNLWGPFLWESDREGDVFNVMPIFWRNWGKNYDHLTIFPLLHVGHDGPATLLATPLFVHATGDQGESTFATWGYGRHRGRTELDVWTPLFWWYRDPDIGLDRKYLFPFLYRNTSPRSDDIVLFPFYAHFEKPAISDTHWITPIFRHETSLTGWSTNIHPLFFMGRENRSTHFVAAPLIWDFASPKDRATVVLPAFFRFADRDTTSQLAFNTYYHEERLEHGSSWEFHFFPFFSYGESPDGHWWNFVYGMAGYTREGTMSKMRALFIPIELSE